MVLTRCIHVLARLFFMYNELHHRDASPSPWVNSVFSLLWWVFLPYVTLAVDITVCVMSFRMQLIFTKDISQFFCAKMHCNKYMKDLFWKFWWGWIWNRGMCDHLVWVYNEQISCQLVWAAPLHCVHSFVCNLEQFFLCVQPSPVQCPFMFL